MGIINVRGFYYDLIRRNIPREYTRFFYIHNHKTKIIDKDNIIAPELIKIINIDEIKRVYSSDFWETITISKDGKVKVTKRKDVYIHELYFYKKIIRLYNRAKRFIGLYE